MKILELIKQKKLGIAEGEVIGTTKSKKEIAKKLKDMGISIERIIEATGLSKEEVEKL